jgi:hypothetical protein
MILILGKSNTDVMTASSLLTTLNIPHDFCPIPREVQFNCGFCISISDLYKTKILDLVPTYHDEMTARDIHIYHGRVINDATMVYTQLA